MVDNNLPTAILALVEDDWAWLHQSDAEIADGWHLAQGMRAAVFKDPHEPGRVILWLRGDLVDNPKFEVEGLAVSLDRKALEGFAMLLAGAARSSVHAIGASPVVIVP